MYCIHCGKEIDDKAVFCVHCGVPTGINPLPTPPAPADMTTFTPPKTQAQTPAQPARNVKPFNGFALTGFILGVSAVVIGVFLFSFVVIWEAVGLDTLSSISSILIDLTFPAAICGLVFSIVGLALRKRYARGMGFAIAGLIVSSIYLLIMILLFVIAIVFVFGLFYMLILLAGLGGGF